MPDTRQTTKYFTYDAFSHFWSNMETYVLPKYIDVRDNDLEAGTYYTVTVDGDGIITAGESKLDASLIDGVISLDNLPSAALERLVVVDDEEAMLALTSTDVQKGDTVKNNDTQIMYYVVDETKLGTIEAFEMYKVGSTASVDWMNVKNKPESLKNPNAIVIKFDDETIETITYDGSNAAEFTIPDKLENPNQLCILLPDETKYEYDGSEEIDATITEDNVTSSFDNESEDDIDDLMKNTIPILTGIFVNNQPNKTSYYQGDLFSPTGMIITATYTNGSRKEVTSQVTYAADPLQLGTTSITFTYVEEEITVTCVLNVTVKALAVDYYETSVGDTVTISHSKYGDIPFLCIGKDHDADGTITLLTSDITQLLAFDAKEPTNTDENRKDYGNNRYAYSTLLQWMNSSATNNWYTAKHSMDAAPTSANLYDGYNPYVNEKGLLAGFAENLLEQLVVTDKTTVIPTVDGGGTETVSSKVFLLSSTEMGLGTENGVSEGTIYEYFMTGDKTAKPSTYCVTNSGGVADESFATTKPFWYWLRTPYSGDSFSARIVTPEGTLDGSSVCNGDCGVRFAITLRKYNK